MAINVTETMILVVILIAMIAVCVVLIMTGSGPIETSVSRIAGLFNILGGA